MFYGLENTQSEIAQQLKTLTEEGSFPSSVLFYGPSGSSRMFAALAVAKHFGSDLDSTLIISDRNYSVRINAALNLFRKSRNQASKRLLKTEVETFLKQFHGALLDSQSPANRKKFAVAGDCAELIQQIDGLAENECETFANKLEKTLSPVLDVSKSLTGNKSSITVNQIRDIRQWASESSLEGRKKVIVIENIENSGDASSNALLKTLEEPPEDTLFILISQNIGRIPATVLSRLRKFRFNSFTEKEKNFVLTSLFVNPSEFDSIDSFFLVYSGADDKLLREQAEKLVSGEKTDERALVKELEKSQTWDRFFHFVTEEIQKAYSKGIISEKYCRYLLDEITNAISKGKAFNQVKRLTFDFVVYRTQEVLQ